MIEPSDIWRFSIIIFRNLQLAAKVRKEEARKARDAEVDADEE